MRRATAYLARRAASTTRLRAVLGRAAARMEETDPDDVPAAIEDVVGRLTRAGLLDDAAFARSKARVLARKGKPADAIRLELRVRYGVEIEADAVAGLDPLVQATRWAERRRLGPFRLRDRERKRQADTASLVRAGFATAIARAVVDGEAPDGFSDRAAGEEPDLEARSGPPVRRG